jgi:hypothetical protein
MSLLSARRLRWWGLIPFGWLVAVSLPAAAQSDCSPTAIAKTRQEFQRAYTARDYAGAATLIDTFWNNCVVPLDKEIDPVLAAAISNDAALANHHAGNDGECLQWLLAYLPMPRHGNPKLDRLPAGLRAAIKHNLDLCTPYCATASAMDASCASISAAAELDAMVVGDFVEKPCPFETGGSPTLAVPGGRCLALFAPKPPPRGETERDVTEQDPELVCPRVALVRQSKGGLVVDPVSVPAHSILRRLGVCCSAINLASDGAGRIEVTAAGNPPVDCISGRRSSAKQDILELRGQALTLRHRLDPRDPD